MLLMIFLALVMRDAADAAQRRRDQGAAARRRYDAEAAANEAWRRSR
jgi:hypothetical protein